MKKQSRFAWVRRLALVSGLLLASLALTSCNEGAGSVYDSQSIAPTFKGKSGDALYEILGPTVIDKGVNFAVYAEHATRVEVLIFDSKNPDTDQPNIRIPMTKDPKSGIWTAFVYGVGVGTHYGYIAFGPNWPYKEDFHPGSHIGFISDCDAEGNRYNPNKLLIDPYARRIHRDFDWMSGNPASGTARNVSSWKAAAKSVVIDSKYEWSENEKKWRENRMKGDAFEGHAANDLIYYEVHPKGFTMKALDDVSNQGTWLGIGEKAKYLADLGITAVELMPVAEKPDDGTYWGYNSIAFFAPEQRYATEANRSKTNGVHDEFKQMVDMLHQAGIEVILDVVYNHTGEGGFWRSRVQSRYQDYGQYSDFDDMTAATIYSWRGLDNKAYYHLKDGNQKYLDKPGVGNQTRTNNKPFRKFIIDNLRFWVEEMHVDGFRFDLASILGYPDENPENANETTWLPTVGNTVVQDIINDEVLQKYNTRLVAEAWNMGMYVNGLFPKATNKDNYAWGEWNGRFRDVIRKFINDDGWSLSAPMDRSPEWAKDVTVGNILTGSSKMYNEPNDFAGIYPDNRMPYHSVNIMTVHDGFTLYDLVTYWENQNNCGKLNPICCDQAYNAFCDLKSGEEHNDSRNWCAENWTNEDGSPGYWQGYVDGSDGKCQKPESEAIKRQMVRNFFAFMFISHGSPLILGGDEYMRTQFGNNNAYSDSADNEWNWFRWGDWVASDDRVRMHDFVRSMIKIRKKYKDHLSPAQYLKNSRNDCTEDFCWWNPNGISSDDVWNTKSIAMYYPQKGNTPELFVMINMEPGTDREFTLPAGEWKVLADTQSYFDYDKFNEDPSLDTKISLNANVDGLITVSGTYGVKPRTVVILGK